MSYYLAIDAGGTKAEYLLADDTRVIARASSETIKRMRLSAEEATANLVPALTELERLAGFSLTQVTRTCIGTSGYTVPLVTDWLHAELGNRVGGELLILGDIEIALDAAFPSTPGVLVLAGTGSNIAGRNDRGELFFAGGYGPVLSDQGSGHRIGHEALRAAFLAYDEGRESTLMDAILRHWSLADKDALVAYGNTCSPREFSALSRVVLTCAENGDAVSNEVLRREAHELAHLALLVYRRVVASATSDSKPSIAYAGSVLQHVLPLRKALEAKLAEVITEPTFVGVVDPIQGALYRARQKNL